MADTSNLTNFLEDVADAIRAKKGTEDPIPAANFDTEIASIETGSDTSDATATADDIINPKTAYISDGKVTGNIQVTNETGILSIANFITNNNEHILSINNNLALVGTYNTNMIKMYKWENNNVTDLLDTFEIIDSDTNSLNLVMAQIGKTKLSNNNIMVAILAQSDSINKTVILVQYDVTINKFIKDNISSYLMSNTSNTGYASIAISPVNSCYVACGAPSGQWYIRFALLSYDINTNTITSRTDSFSGNTYVPTTAYVEWDQSGTYISLRAYRLGSSGENNRNAIYRFFDNSLSKIKEWRTQAIQCLWNNTYYFYNNTLKQFSGDTTVKVYNEFNVSIGNTIMWTYNNYLFIVNYSSLQNILYCYKIDEVTLELTLLFQQNVQPYTSELYNSYVGSPMSPSSQQNLYYFDTMTNCYVFQDEETSIPSTVNIKGYTLYNLYDINVTSDKVLEDEIFANYSGKTIGTMPNNGELVYNVSTEEQVIPEGYTSGGTIAASPLTIEEYGECLEISQNILSGDNSL